MASTSGQPTRPHVAGNQPRQDESQFRQIFGFIQRALLIYFGVQIVTSFFTPKGVPSSTTEPSRAPSSTDVASNPQASINPFTQPPVTVEAAWPLGSHLDLHFYLSGSPRVEDVFVSSGTTLPNFVWNNVTYGDLQESRSIQLSVDVPASVQNNGTLFAHMFLARNGANPDPHNSGYDRESVTHLVKLLTRYLPKPRTRKARSLLEKSSEVDEDKDHDLEADQVVSFWHSNLTLALVSDQPSMPFQKLAPPVAQYVRLAPGKRDTSGTIGYYNPILFTNDFWQLRSQLVEINSTTQSLPLNIDFYGISYFKFQLYASLTFGFEEAAKNQGGGHGELDEIKRMLTETNPWFLGLTAVVSLLHSVFEFLAFSSDVQHWRKKSELVGVSLRTIVTNVFVQLVILLYLVDNNESTSWMILVGQGLGMVIEAWKITKAVVITVVPNPGSLIPYRVKITDKHVLSEDEKKTQEYDRLAFRYVSYVTIPLLVAYTGYSLVYEKHSSVYSFIISTLTSFVYMFGFVQLVPQLIINYKLKSVAHMPMKAMVFKTLSTVVDDLFAFCIKMPFLHRLACFRDDVVFLVFLYQRYIYSIDYARVNEYGQVATVDEKGENKKDK